MSVSRWIALSALGAISVTALAQERPPLADRVDEPRLPAGISEQDVDFGGLLASLFKDKDGTQAVHILGDFLLQLGGDRGLTARGGEAVVWISKREHEKRLYQHLQIFIWQEVEVQEVGGTLTLGPALFLTLSTFGKVNTHVDDVSLDSSADSAVYKQGNAIRQTLNASGLRGLDAEVTTRIFDASGLANEAKTPRVRPVLRFQSKGEFAMAETAAGERIITVIGGVYMARGVPGSGEYLEIQADSVVVFLPPARPSVNGTDAESAPEKDSQALGPSPPKFGRPDPDQADPRSGQVMATGLGDLEVESVYLEGDVVMAQGPHSIRASRLHYDFVQDQAMILDAVIHTTIAGRNVPIYIRASEIRQLSTRKFAADDAIVTTSEFYTPHYHIGARRVELVDRSPAEIGLRPGEIRAGSFRIEDATLNIGGRPIAYWPAIRGNVDASETAIKSLRVGYSDDFGAELETKWSLFNLLNLETPDGFEATLSLDYFTERGPAAGVDVDYLTDHYFGELKSYVLSDSGQDSLGRDREVPSSHDLRGRFLLRHRQYLEDDWQLTLELSHLSDRGFLEEFFESEFDNDKEQETLLNLKKQRDNWAFTALLQARILDFTTQTERFPDLSFHLAGQPLGDHLSWFSENRAGLVRYRSADQTFRELLRDGSRQSSGTVLRADSRQEIGAPLDLGSWRFVPFAAARGTTWDDSPSDGALTRGFGIVGFRGSTYLWRVYPEVKSSLGDIDGIRHLIKPEITAWGSGANVHSGELFAFDESVERIDQTSGVNFGIRQRWQTKRGEGDARRSVDVVTWDVDAAAFNHADGTDLTNGFTSFSRPENSIARNYVHSSVVWRINDRTALLNEMNYDMTDGEVDIANVSLAVERTPRLSYLIGYRFIDESESNVLALDFNYQMTEKHTLALRELFDLDRGRTLDLTVALIRKLPRWYSAVSFALDEAEDDIGVSFSLWPEGLPGAALGSRRFTGLSRSTQLIND